MRPEQLAKDLEKLGPTFVKLGQLLSGRSDLPCRPQAAYIERSRVFRTTSNRSRAPTSSGSEGGARRQDLKAYGLFRSESRSRLRRWDRCIRRRSATDVWSP